MQLLQFGKGLLAGRFCLAS